MAVLAGADGQTEAQQLRATGTENATSVVAPMVALPDAIFCVSVLPIDAPGTGENETAGNAKTPGITGKTLQFPGVVSESRHGDSNPGPTLYESVGQSPQTAIRAKTSGKRQNVVTGMVTGLPPKLGLVAPPEPLPTDPDLARVIDNWPSLPPHIRAAVLALVETSPR